jgi:sulfite reductase beta subunit-like hemoprotein
MVEARGFAREQTQPRAAPKAVSGSLLGQQCNWFGLSIPFGAADTATWRAVAGWSEQFGTGVLRFSPQRVVLLPNVALERAAQLAREAQQAGLIIADSDPLLHVVACSGAPACSAAWGETRALARRLADSLRPLLGTGATLHVSGCSKSCASSQPADVTLVHEQDGVKLAFAADVPSSMAEPTLSLALAEARLQALAHTRSEAHHGPPAVRTDGTHDTAL